MAVRCYHCGEAYPVAGPDVPSGTPCIAMYEGHETNKPSCQAIVICTLCMEKCDFDMWTNEREWASTNPLVPYSKLPPFDHDDPDRDDPTRYPTVDQLMGT